ncbi:MAG: hypothetical protein ACRETI_08635 [Steroidobacteraceae bacterium]
MKILLAIALLWSLTAAAEPVFEKTVIRLFEQADGPILPISRRLYSTRFNAMRTRMLAVEISAAYPLPAATTTIAVTCTLTKPDGSQAPSDRPMSFQFVAGQTESHSANLLWGMPADQDWKSGGYEIECLAAEKPIGKLQFEIAMNPAEVADGDIRVETLRIFPVQENLPPRLARQYANALVAEKTSRIGIELEFSHAPLGRTVKIPVDCYFFWPDGQTSPPLVLSYEPQPTWAGGYSAGAMGWEQPGSWSKGVYTVSCAIHGQPVMVDRFDVT